MPDYLQYLIHSSFLASTCRHGLLHIRLRILHGVQKHNLPAVIIHLAWASFYGLEVKQQPNKLRAYGWRLQDKTNLDWNTSYTMHLICEGDCQHGCRFPNKIMNVSLLGVSAQL